MNIDTSYITELYEAEHIGSYGELMDYMGRFDKRFYEKWDIFVQPHHITPPYECSDLDEEEEIMLPVSIHFIAHILRARESDNDTATTGNYTEAFLISRKHPFLEHAFRDEWEEAKARYKKHFRPLTYDQAYGKTRADIVRKKISKAMSKLDPEVIKKRSDKIRAYARERPKEHNAKIAQSNMKPVAHMDTGRTYRNAKEASEATGLSVSYIRFCCKKKKGGLFEYGK